jgi:hypothetical protein
VGWYGGDFLFLYGVEMLFLYWWYGVNPHNYWHIDIGVFVCASELFPYCFLHSFLNLVIGGIGWNVDESGVPRTVTPPQTVVFNLSCLHNTLLYRKTKKGNILRASGGGIPSLFTGRLTPVELPSNSSYSIPPLTVYQPLSKGPDTRHAVYLLITLLYRKTKKWKTAYKKYRLFTILLEKPSYHSPLCRNPKGR